MRARRRIALFAILLLLVGAACSGDEEPQRVAETEAEPTPTPEPKCPLTGLDVPPRIDPERPAIAVKIENSPDAYPLSGLHKAEIVYEELVEGGQTRFMALYHCTDTDKAGPVRSTRVVDPAIMTPATRILVGAGGNDIVREALDKAKVVLIDEDTAGDAMQRIPRSGISFEHTLYGDTAALRKIGDDSFDEPPPPGLFLFGDTPQKGKKAKGVTLSFSGAITVTYTWTGTGWQREDFGLPLTDESGAVIEVDNVIIEQHTEINSTKLFDVAGNPSPEITDVTGKGTAVLLRDGIAIKGSWVRKAETDRIVYQTLSGEELVLKPGTTWVELVPNQKGELKGSFKILRKKGSV